MGGRPMAKATALWLNKLGDAACERLIFDRLADGCSTRKLTQELAVIRELDDGGPMTRSGVYDWMRETPEREEAWQLALKLGGEAHADESGEILDAYKDHVFMSKEQVKIAELRSNHRKWLASVSDRERFGEARNAGGGNMTVNVEQLHLHATVAVGSALDSVFERPAPVEEIEEAEVEVIEEGRRLPARVTTLDDLFGETPKAPTLADILGD